MRPHGILPVTLYLENQTMPDSTIIYTETDEAPALATYSLFPVVQAFSRV